MITNIVRRDELKRWLKEARLWVKIVNGGLSILDDEKLLALEYCYIHKVKCPFRGRNSLPLEVPVHHDNDSLITSSFSLQSFLTWFAVPFQNGVSQLHSTRVLQTMSLFLFAKLILPYRCGSA